MQALKRQIKVACKLYLATHRAAKTRWIVADQRELITKLSVWGQPTLDAERSLQEYISALEPLEDNERRIREEREAENQETKEPQANLGTSDNYVELPLLEVRNPQQILNVVIATFATSKKNN